MARNLIKANASHITSRVKRDESDFSASPDIDNSGREVRKPRNFTHEINAKYALSGDLNVQRAENCGFTNAELTRFQFSANQAIYNPSPFVAPSSWSSVNFVVPDSHAIGKTVTGNDGRQYIEMRDKTTGQVDYVVGEHSCLNANADVFNPSFATPKSLRNDDDHFQIKYNVKTDGTVIAKTHAESALAAGLIDFDNAYTKPSLNSLTIITNDVLAQRAPSFSLSAKSGIVTAADPTENFSGAVSGVTAPVQSVVLKPNAQLAPWQLPKSQDDSRKFEL